jgi:hypothetical protein
VEGLWCPKTRYGVLRIAAVTTRPTAAAAPVRACGDHRLRARLTRRISTPGCIFEE